MSVTSKGGGGGGVLIVHITYTHHILLNELKIVLFMLSRQKLVFKVP